MDPFISRRFEVERYLGRSKKAVSFRARDLWSGNHVLVKTFEVGQGLKTDGLAERFAWFRGLQHPLIARVFWVGLTPRSRCCVVREWRDRGETLATRIPADTDRISGQLIDAAALLGKSRKFHGRIKPSNVWVSDGRLCLLDGGFPPLDVNDATLEEIPYLAPEVLAGGRPTVESDLYSLGAVLYRLHSGRSLFEDPDATALRDKCIYAKPPEMSDVSDASQAFSQAVSGLVATSPDKRAAAFARIQDLFSSSPGPAGKAPMAGRRKELSGAVSSLGLVAANTRVIVIEADAGEGKTRFVEEVAFRHEFKGGHFLTGRCYERDNRQFEAVLQILAERFKRCDVTLEEWGRLEGGRFAHSLQALLPELEIAPRLVSAATEVTTQKLVADLVGALVSMARVDSSIAFCFEDMQWVDPGTLQVLEQLCLRANEADFGLAITGRSLPVSFMRGVRHSGVHLEQVQLAPLSPTQAMEMARMLACDASQATRIAKNSDGNPLFLEEWARFKDSVAGPLPQRISDVILEKVRSLDSPLRAMAEIVSLFPKSIAPQLASMASEVNLLVSEVSLRMLVDKGLLTQSGDDFAFRHDGIRQTVYRQISPARRKRLHRRMYEVLTSVEAVTPSVGYHACCAGMFNEAIDAYRRAALLSWSVRDGQGSVDQFAALMRLHRRTNLQVPPADVLTYAECLEFVGRTKEARKLLQGIFRRIPEGSEGRAKLCGLLGACSREVPYQSVRYHLAATEAVPAESHLRPKLILNLAQAHTAAGQDVSARKALSEVEKTFELSSWTTPAGWR